MFYVFYVWHFDKANRCQSVVLVFGVPIRRTGLFVLLQKCKRVQSRVEWAEDRVYPCKSAKKTLSCKRYAFAFVPFALWFKSQAFSFLPLQPFRENLTPPLILCSGPISEGSTRTVLLFLYGDLLTTFTIDDNPRNHTRTAETIYYLCSPTHELF